MIFRKLVPPFLCIASVLCIAAAPAQAAAPARSATPTPCTATDLTLAFDGEQGNYNGMSHGGDLLILRNIRNRVCTVAQRPQLTFQDDAGKPVALRMQVPPGMHPGPVLLPVAIPPQAEATGTMRWVSGDAFGAGNCVHTTKAILTLGNDTVEAPFQANLCGPAGAIPQYEQESLHRDAPFTPHGAVR